MSVHRTKKQSDIEKRFKHLEFQLYGKPDKKKVEVRDEKLGLEVGSEKSNLSHLPSQIPTSYPLRPRLSSTQARSEASISRPTSTSDTTFLRHDLTKIAFLSSVAVGVQVLLYFALSNHSLRLPF